jgi:hypothetical protein
MPGRGTCGSIARSADFAPLIDDSETFLESRDREKRGMSGSR